MYAARSFCMGEIGLCEDRNLSRPLIRCFYKGNGEYKYVLIIGVIADCGICGMGQIGVANRFE